MNAKKLKYKCSCPPPQGGGCKIISAGCQIHGVKAGEYEQEYAGYTLALPQWGAKKRPLDVRYEN